MIKWELKELLEAECTQQGQRMTHMHQPRLHVAFDPARALTNPITYLAVRFFICGRVDHPGAIAMLEHANAQVGVFGDVERIPRAQFTQPLGVEVILRCRLMESARPCCLSRAE